MEGWGESRADSTTDVEERAENLTVGDHEICTGVLLRARCSSVSLLRPVHEPSIIFSSYGTSITGPPSSRVELTWWENVKYTRRNGMC